MKTFPKKAKFNFPWRSYQSTVLAELANHLEDNHLNIVAAPGSGKTILGLEVMLRINKPTLVLAPSIAIRNQWIARFTENFLQLEETPKWISSDIKNPQFLTVSTYQGLHAAFTNQKEQTDEETELEDEPEIIIKEELNKKYVGAKDILPLDENSKKTNHQVLKKLQEKHIQTIIMDEAHHLRSEWWKSLIYLKDNLEDLSIVALTATPPYDVSAHEWKNYQDLCGPIDAEISVPELVLEKNLCPHQDYIFLNGLSDEEVLKVKTFRTDVEIFLKNLETNIDFISMLEQHPCILNPEENIEIILKSPAYYSSIAIFLKKVNGEIIKNFFKIISGENQHIPQFTKQWATILLEDCLYKDEYLLENSEHILKGLRRELKKIKALEKRQIYLENNREIKKLLKESLNKLNSILEIVDIEHTNLKENLRMVILTDFIRSEAFPTKKLEKKRLNSIGVVPIFESIRQKYPQMKKLGILSGSIVVIPNSAQKSLLKIAQTQEILEKNIQTTTLIHDKNFLKVKIKGVDNQKIVSVMTELFGQGDIEIMVGTKSLLGEGWDAPSINTLVLASFVGSFMLSNQMRGRAIRMDKNNKKKISNIWHLASIETFTETPGHDFEILQKRFKAFVGVSLLNNTIRNGIERLDIKQKYFTEEDIRISNIQTKYRATNRKKIGEKWKKILATGEIKKIVPAIKTQRNFIPKNFVFRKNLITLFWKSYSLGYLIFNYSLTGVKYFMNYKTADGAVMAFWVIGGAFCVALAISLPGVIKSLFLFLRNGPISGQMEQVARVLLETFCEVGILKTDKKLLDIEVERDKNKSVFCGLKGGTSHEKSIFLKALSEILDPIENPRYILIRGSFFASWFRKDYHSVPQIIGVHKKSAKIFAKNWGKLVGRNKLIYTRTIDGRKLLLRARQKAMSTSFQKRSERIDSWK